MTRKQTAMILLYCLESGCTSGYPAMWALAIMGIVTNTSLRESKEAALKWLAEYEKEGNRNG